MDEQAIKQFRDYMIEAGRRNREQKYESTAASTHSAKRGRYCLRALRSWSISPSWK